VEVESTERNANITAKIYVPIFPAGRKREDRSTWGRKNDGRLSLDLRSNWNQSDIPEIE